jgi:hypothetical protein
MRALFAAALVLAATPAFAEPDQTQSMVVRGERGVSTRVQLRGASRIAYQRLCRTPTEWRERLGPDWRQVLAGRSPEDDLDTLAEQNRSTLEVPGTSPSDSFGRPGGGTSGPLAPPARQPR